jgi:hypothetical protein
MTRIITTYVYPPIPVRTSDWSAHIDGREEDGPYGWGRTRDEAVADLEEQLADIACEYAARIETHCETARSDDWLALVRACNEKELNNDC